MGFLVSPGVHVREIDLTNIIPAIQTNIAAFAGPFERGPVSSVTAISSEAELAQVFGEPNEDNFEYWFTAANFLQYSNALRLVRMESGILNACSELGLLIRDNDHYKGSYRDGQGSVGPWAARTAGDWGNSLKVSICAKLCIFWCFVGMDFFYYIHHTPTRGSGRTECLNHFSCTAFTYIFNCTAFT